MIDMIPTELIIHILSYLPLIDRVKCESINRKLNSICKELWNCQTSIDEKELPRIRWIKEYQTISPHSSDQSRSDRIRWQLTLKCPRIKKMVIDDETLNSTFFIQRVPFVEHLTVKRCTENFVSLTEAKSLQTIAFEMGDCSEYNVIKHLTTNIKSIEGPSICTPWVDKWDEFFEHSKSAQFCNLVKLTVVISLQNNNQLENIFKLQELNHIRFLIGDEFDNNFLIKYLQHRGSKLKGLELVQPNYHISCGSVFAAVANNCYQLENFGMKGYLHGKMDYNYFRNLLFNFKSLKILSLNIPRTLTEEEVGMVCHNNHNLGNFVYTYYMPSITPHKLKNWKQNCDEMKLRIDEFNQRNPGRRKIFFKTNHIINEIFLNKL